MSRDWRIYLGDIRTACEKVLRFTAGMDRLPAACLPDMRCRHGGYDGSPLSLAILTH